MFFVYKKKTNENNKIAFLPNPQFSADSNYQEIGASHTFELGINNKMDQEYKEYLNNRILADSDFLIQATPIIRKEEDEKNILPCESHPKKKAKYFDISEPGKLFCSKCALDIFIN